MSKIIPFAALLPDPKLASAIVAPPYDVVDSSEARQLVQGNPHSLLHITRAEVDLPPAIDEHDARVYERAGDNFRAFCRDGWLQPSPASFFVYRIRDGAHAQTGIVCGASVDEYDAGAIRKHEKTRAIKEDDRTRFACTVGAHAEPVILVHRADQKIRALLADATQQTPLFAIADRDGALHELFALAPASGIAEAFACLAALYIADGHHRSAAASRTRAWMRDQEPAAAARADFFPAVIFPADELRIYRYDWDGDPRCRPLADLTMADIMDLADRGGILPPKSTWFAPKLLSGLFVYPFRDA